MYFTSPATAVVVLLAATGALAAPMPRHHHHEDLAESHGHSHNGGHHHHDDAHSKSQSHSHSHSRHGKHVSHVRIGLGQWIQQHMHYPHHWPFHPQHQPKEDHEDDHENKAGSMFGFWLNSHFAPHTSSTRTHRGSPLFLQQGPASAFDSKPDHPRHHHLLAARDLDSLEGLSEEGGEDHSEHGHGELSHHHVKLVHKEMKKLGKLVEKEMKKHNKLVETEMQKAQRDAHHAAKEMHLHIGMAAAKHGHGSDHGELEIDELD